MVSSWLAMGGWPPATSMIASRRWPSPTGPSSSRPSPSGRRWRSTSRIRLRRASSTVSLGSRLTIPAMPHMGSARALANAGRRHGPPRPMSHARQVLGDEEGEVHLGASQHPAALRVPLLCTLAHNRLAGHVAQRAKESSVELVVMRRTQISVRAVPAPAPMVIPEIEGADQSGDSVREQLTHPALSRLRGGIPEAEQAEEEAVEHAGQRVAGVLLVQRVAVLQRPDAAVLDVLLEDARGGAAQLEQMLAAAQAVGPDEHADGQPLSHRADPRGLELAAPLAPVERVGPDDRTVVPADGMVHEPVDLSGERRQAVAIRAAEPALQGGQAVPGHVGRVVALAERPGALDRDALRGELHGVEEQSLAVDVVVQRVAVAARGHRLERTREPEAERLAPQRPPRPPPGREPPRPPTHRRDERHTIDTSQLPMARWRRPKRSRTSSASSG